MGFILQSASLPFRLPTTVEVTNFVYINILPWLSLNIFCLHIFLELPMIAVMNNNISYSIAILALKLHIDNCRIFICVE